ncbi:ubiquitin carrier protein [Salpingoeca rosetta]|uniref:E2 ubiquitin-conjugating enzyme n=1 Tax=Salpingoeca rosetta (strain ATCC 50818 / BSB-021) TaxID=946362 RepID=F2UL60_SALR5|nr:ubiquitin carrier protein [Salpingoeca rosetta]EGD77859.1 ubiquitin carrier protein [Salpingoeca rosetta]|eukprot:XP_004989923.1 ubiquitin carrier protein [Salpingoeca rosetta]
MSGTAALLLQRQLKELQKNPVDGFSAGLKDDNIFHWEVMIMPQEGSPYNGAMFCAELVFPKDYPSNPPKMRFVKVIPWHPNVYEDGRVCISILHPPGDDEYGYEDASERWLPVHTVTTILLSVTSMLADPNDESPANLEAAKEWREDKETFKKKVRSCVRRSQEEAFL